MKCRILVSGADGQLGKSIQDLAQKYPEYEFDFFGRTEFNLEDQNSIANVFQKDYNYFINAAAYTKVDLAESESEKAYKINSESLETITKYCPISCKIIHISTDYVYNHNPGRHLLESDKTEAASVYSKSKLSGEKILLEQRPESIIIRSSWIYSEHGNNFVKTMLRLARDRDELNIVADQLGSPTYARDLADAIFKIINYFNLNPEVSDLLGGIYNYSNEECTNWAEFAEHIFLYSGISCKVNPITTAEYPTPAVRPLWSYMSKEKIKDSFSLEILDWKASLKICLSILKDAK